MEKPMIASPRKVGASGVGTTGNGHQARWDKSYYGKQTASGEADRFLPDFVVAWLLLQRSGLEKSVITANLKNQFTVERVKDALKLTCPDDDLRKRDTGRQGAYVSVENEALLADLDDDDHAEDLFEAQNEEEEQAYMSLEKEAQSAWQRSKVFQGGPTRTSRPVSASMCGGPHLRKDCDKEPQDPKIKSVHFVFHTVEEPENGAAAEANDKTEKCLAAERFIQETWTYRASCPWPRW